MKLHAMYQLYVSYVYVSVICIICICISYMYHMYMYQLYVSYVYVSVVCFGKINHLEKTAFSVMRLHCFKYDKTLSLNLYLSFFL